MAEHALRHAGGSGKRAVADHVHAAGSLYAADTPATAGDAIVPPDGYAAWLAGKAERDAAWAERDAAFVAQLEANTLATRRLRRGTALRKQLLDIVTDVFDAFGERNEDDLYWYQFFSRSVKLDDATAWDDAFLLDDGGKLRVTMRIADPSPNLKALDKRATAQERLHAALLNAATGESEIVIEGAVTFSGVKAEFTQTAAQRKALETALSKRVTQSKAAFSGKDFLALALEAAAPTPVAVTKKIKTIDPNAYTKPFLDFCAAYKQDDARENAALTLILDAQRKKGYDGAKEQTSLVDLYLTTETGSKRVSYSTYLFDSLAFAIQRAAWDAEELLQACADSVQEEEEWKEALREALGEAVSNEAYALYDTDYGAAANLAEAGVRDVQPLGTFDVHGSGSVRVKYTLRDLAANVKYAGDPFAFFSAFRADVYAFDVKAEATVEYEETDFTVPEASRKDMRDMLESLSYTARNLLQGDTLRGLTDVITPTPLAKGASKLNPSRYPDAFKRYCEAYRLAEGVDTDDLTIACAMLATRDLAISVSGTEPFMRARFATPVDLFEMLREDAQAALKAAEGTGDTPEDIRQAMLTRFAAHAIVWRGQRASEDDTTYEAEIGLDADLTEEAWVETARGWVSAFQSAAEWALADAEK